MKKIINQLKLAAAKDILIVGDIMLDEYIFGTVNRISPEAPVPVVKEASRSWSLGGAANVAANCKHIGFNVNLIGLIGENDRSAQTLVGMLKQSNVSFDGVIKSPERVTTCKRRIMEKNHQLLRIDTENDDAISVTEFGEMVVRIDKLMKKNMIVLLSDYAKGLISKELIGYVITKARMLDCIVMVDPKGPDFFKYAGVDYVKPNLKEFSQMVRFFGLCETASLLENGRAIARRLQLKGLIITLGDKGIYFVSEDTEILCPAVKHEVYDLTGAGDTVFAFLALGIAHNLEMLDCLRLANKAASIAISHVKTYAVSLDELIDRHLEPSEKVIHDWASLKIELDWQRLDGKKVILTNGCFDILHSGHISTLKEAKKFGDILVVALNTDASVKRLKGPSRPINDLDERSAMMAAIGVVDFVVSFDQDTPQALLEYLRPDILVKGGDYKAHEVVGYDFMKSYGGRVEIIDFVPGRSTTNVIAAINKS